MATLADLIAQKDALEKQIEAARKAELKNAINQAKAIVAAHGLTAEDIFGKDKVVRKSTNKVAPKYRDPATGATWTGRGRTPQWLQGKTVTDFLIA